MVYPVEISQSPEGIHIRARIRFCGFRRASIQGEPWAALVERELRRQFSGENPFLSSFAGTPLDFPERLGQPVAFSLELSVERRGPAVRFFLLPVRGISCSYGFPFWRRWGSKNILLFSGDIRTRLRYSPSQAAKVACHEFGHAMGIGDLYGGFAPYGPCYRPAAAVTAEMPACDIMRTHFREDWFTPNDLEMACLAFAQNAPQSHVRTGLWKGLRRPSAAVRGERIDLARESARRQRRPLARLLAHLGKRGK